MASRFMFEVQSNAFNFSNGMWNEKECEQSERQTKKKQLIFDYCYCVSFYHLRRNK